MVVDSCFVMFLCYNNKMEPRPSLQKVERQNEFHEFIIDLLNDRHEIDRQLAIAATHKTATFSSVNPETYQPTASLTGFLNAISTSAEINLAISARGRDITIEKMTINQNDGAPVYFLNQGPFVRIDTSGKDSLIGDVSLLDDALLSIIPVEYRTLGPHRAQLIEYVNSITPIKTLESEFVHDNKDFRSIIRMTQSESIDDSVHTLEIQKLANHPSGIRVGTRMVLVESIQRAISNGTTDKVTHSLALELVRTQTDDGLLTVESIIQTADMNQVIALDTGTREHMGNLLEALNILKQEALLSDESRPSSPLL